MILLCGLHNSGQIIRPVHSWFPVEQLGCSLAHRTDQLTVPSLFVPLLLWYENQQCETSSVKKGPNGKLLMSYITISFSFHFKNWNIFSNQEMVFFNIFYIYVYVYIYFPEKIYIFITGDPKLVIDTQWDVKQNNIS